MDPVVTAAAIQGGSSAASGILGYFSAREARKWQEKMWEKQNEYNLPVNQVARLKEAGINPNLAFGSAASAMGTSVPGQPAYYKPDLSGIGDAAQNYFKNKLERQAVLANIARQNADTRRQNVESDFLEAVLQDKIDAYRWTYKSEGAKGQWFAQNNDEWYESQLAGRQFQNDVLKAEILLKEAQQNFTWQNYRNAIQSYNHLVNKYGFEDKYYMNGLNPYETSTVAGALRTVNGMLGQLAGVPGFTFQNARQLNKDLWKDWKQSGMSLGEYIRQLRNH